MRDVIREAQCGFFFRICWTLILVLGCLMNHLNYKKLPKGCGENLMLSFLWPIDYLVFTHVFLAFGHCRSYDRASGGGSLDDAARGDAIVEVSR